MKLQYMIVTYYTVQIQLYKNMKNRLGRIRTTYNQQGNYDEQQYFKQQKSVYAREIDFATRVDAITEKQFTLKPIQIKFLNSTVLKDDQKFKQIKKIFTQYNKNILENGGAPVNGLHFKKIVMEAMIKFMNLMLLAPDANTKKTILDIAYYWFIKHLDPKSGNKTTKQLQKQIKQLIVQKQLLPIDIVNRQLLINKINQQLHPYKIKARTMYKELNDPKVQLQNYNTHKLQFVSQNVKDNKEKNKNNKWIDNLKFPKIQPLPYSIQVQNQEKKQQNQNITDRADTQQVQNNVQPPLEGQLPQEPKLDADGKPIIQQPPVQNQQTQPADLDFGQPAEPDAQPQPEEQQPQDKKKGRLDPLLKVFVLERIRNKQKQEVSCDKIRQKQMNIKNLTYEQDLLNGDYIREWARQKARLKTQISKKHQSIRGPQKIARGKLDQSNKFIENDIDRIKVHSTIAEYKKNINAVQIPPDKLNSESGLSLFDRRRVKTEAAQKPFSSILTDYSRKAQQNAIMQQISTIKQKFAKYKLYGPMDKLIKGLAPPDEQYFEEQQRLVWPNSQMLSNPFIKVAKKKKKKKKK